MTKQQSQEPAAPPIEDREATIRRITEAHERLMHLLSAGHSAEFVEFPMTMSQAKVLYLVASAGEIHMAELPGRLGVSLSTVSGLVDRLVDHGFLVRRDDPADRRQVVVGVTDAGAQAIERFRELNVRQLHELLEHVDPAALQDVERGYAILVTAATSVAEASDASHPTEQRKGGL